MRRHRRPLPSSLSISSPSGNSFDWLNDENYNKKRRNRGNDKWYGLVLLLLMGIVGWGSMNYAQRQQNQPTKSRNNEIPQSLSHRGYSNRMIITKQPKLVQEERQSTVAERPVLGQVQDDTINNHSKHNYYSNQSNHSNHNNSRHDDDPRYVFENRQELLTAVDLILEKPSTAIERYGRLASWDVSNIDDFSHLFSSFRNQKARMFNDPGIQRWNVSQGRNFEACFRRATSFQQPLDSWDLSSATNLAYMFAFTEQFDQSLHAWGTNNMLSQVTNW